MCSPANVLVDRDRVHAGAGTASKAICGKLCGLRVRWLDSRGQADPNGLRWLSSHPVVGPKCRERSLNPIKFLVWPVSFLFNLVGSPSCLWPCLASACPLLFRSLSSKLLIVSCIVHVGCCSCSFFISCVCVLNPFWIFRLWYISAFSYFLCFKPTHFLPSAVGASHLPL